MQKTTSKNNLFSILAWAIVVASVLFRLVIFFQNRDLIIDEANVARNIYERSFAALATPLSYEQYAPPVFLWVVKLCTMIAGFSEYVLRAYPLICGVTSVFVFYQVAKKLLPGNSIWYALLLFGFAHILIRYSSELKQYMPDVLISLSLLYLALSISTDKLKRGRFILLWGVVGSVAIWSSMPSVFILFSIGLYYFINVLKSKSYHRIIDIVIISVVWLLQFGLYYYYILEPQANSDYLQNFHHHYFLFATPSDMGQWDHNWRTFSALMIQFEGLYPYAHDINTVLLLIGLIALFVKDKARFALVVTPVAVLIFAAMVDQFSLLPRVALFSVPILILIVSYGLSTLLNVKKVIIKGAVALIGVYVIVCNVRQTREMPFKYEELTEGYQYVLDKDIEPINVGIHHSSVPASIYYTEIHPNKQNWQYFANAHQLHWYTRYDSLSWQIRYVQQVQEPVAIIYTNATDAEYRKRDSLFSVNMVKVDSFKKSYLKISIYENPDKPY